MSIVVTFIPMYLYDVSLNLMSLGGLALGIGMLVDNAVVALENIQVHLDRGSDRKTAALRVSRSRHRNRIVYTDHHLRLFADYLCRRCRWTNLWRPVVGRRLLFVGVFGCGYLFCTNAGSLRVLHSRHTIRGLVRSKWTAIRFIQK